MDPGEIYAKTEEGLRELKERKRGLPITLRGLLIMVDGTRTVAEILQRARALHLDKSALAELENAGLITTRRSHITIVDRRALEKSSNGTYVPPEG